MGLSSELARSALAQGQWIAAVTHTAMARGFSHVRSIACFDASGDIILSFDRHRWLELRSPTTIRLSGRQLEGSRTGAYIAELVRVMEEKPPTAWPALAHWIARLMPLHPSLTAPAPKPAQPDRMSPHALRAQVNGAVEALSAAGLVDPAKVDAMMASVAVERMEHRRGPFASSDFAARPPAWASARAPLMREVLDGLWEEMRAERMRRESAAAEATIAGVQRDFTRVLLEAGHSFADVAVVLLRAGLSPWATLGVLREVDRERMDDGDHGSFFDELQIRVLELAEQGRGQ